MFLYTVMLAGLWYVCCLCIDMPANAVRHGVEYYTENA